MLSKWNSHSFSVLDCQVNSCADSQVPVLSSCVLTVGSFHMVGVLQSMFSTWTNWTGPLFCSCISFSVSLPFYGPLTCISFHKSPNNSPLSHSVLIYVLFLPFSSFQLYLFMNVSLSPDIILCSCLGSKHQLTYLHAYSTHEDHCAH